MTDKDTMASLLNVQGKGYRKIAIVYSDDFEELVQEAIQEYSEKIADNIGCKQHQVREILSRRMSAGDEINYDTGSIEYRAAEFDALSGRASVKGTDYDDFKRVGPT